MSIVYEYHGGLYINLTNKCLMSCTYCIKYKWKGKFRGHSLFLKKEPTAKAVIKAIGDPSKYNEIIFCGYGEPLMKLDVLKLIAAYVKEHGGKVRINTSGNANLYFKRDITPELKGLVDAISISLNASNAKQYIELNKPVFGEQAFQAVLDFAKACKKNIPDVTLTTVDMPGVDVKKCSQLAKKIHVKFRIRPYLDEYETH